MKTPLPHSEKADIEHHETVDYDDTKFAANDCEGDVLDDEQTRDHEAQNIDPAFSKRVVRKIDLRLLPILSALYCISLIDRVNVSSARVAGMAKDLELTVGERYSIITCVYFVPSILFELPSNLVIRRVGCRNLLSTIVIAWGAVMIGMAFLKNWTQLVACRVLLGFFEAGFFPGCTLLISSWYTRYEQARRFAWFYTAAQLVSGFAASIAYAFSLLSGRAGLHGWQWIFLLFGIITVALGILAIFCLVDFPHKANFLTTEEKRHAIQRVEEDRGDAKPDQPTFSKVLRHIADWQTWVFGMLFLCATVPAYAFAYFLPVILQGGGFTSKQSMLLTTPPYVAAVFYATLIAHYSDKTRARAPFVAGSALLTLTGLLVLAFTKPVGVRYLGCFMTVCGCQSNIPGVLAYQANNVLSSTKRAVSSAIVVGLGGVGGILASLVFRQVDYPRYLPGLGATIGCQGLTIVLCAVLSAHYARCNRLADQGQLVIEGNPRFRYTI